MRTEIHNIIPEDLNIIFDSLEYEEGDLFVNGINFEQNNAVLNFTLKLDYGNEVIFQNWKLVTANCVDLKIDFDEIEQYFEFYSEHFLLTEFEDFQTEIYTKNSTENSEKLLAKLFDLHYSKFENLFKIDKFIIEKNLLNRCKISNGIFARGPKTILDDYFTILKEFNTNPYYFGNQKPKIWKGENWEENNTKYKICVLGKNYFIGTDFKFEKIS